MNLCRPMIKIMRGMLRLHNIPIATRPAFENLETRTILFRQTE
jgi:hypothetical protein